MNAPTVVPRWEWRTFGDLDASGGELAAMRDASPDVSDETYLLSRTRDASVKIRNGLLDVKELQHVDGSGLQLWVPTAKIEFPATADALDQAFAALGVADVRVVEVHKVRHRSELDGCMVEYTELTADGLDVHTFAAESPDRDLVIATVRRLGLEGRRNTCVPQGLRTLVGWKPDRFAVVDVGTNSVKLTVGDRREGAPATEPDTAVVTRLGEGLSGHGELQPGPMARTADAIADLVDGVRGHGPTEIVAVGTAGLRQAPNRDELLDLVLARSGVIVEVISGPEEARLAYRAAVSSLPDTAGRLLVFDSGGGSSQFTFGRRDAIEEQFSLDIGAARIAELFGLDRAVPADTVHRALAEIEIELARLTDHARPDHVIAIGGTATNLAAVSRALPAYDPDVVHGTVLDVAEIDRQIELYRSRAAPERRGIVGLQPARAEVVLAGACIVRTIATLTGQDSLTVSDRGLRHGVAAERFGG